MNIIIIGITLILFGAFLTVGGCFMLTSADDKESIEVGDIFVHAGPGYISSVPFAGIYTITKVGEDTVWYDVKIIRQDGSTNAFSGETPRHEAFRFDQKIHRDK